MLVRREPPSFGYTRLMTQVGNHPDIGVFMGRNGTPDFLAETGSRQHQYFILYYLSSRRAYACRTRSGNGRDVEFAGPYPITKGEYKLLNGFRTNAERRRKGP